MFRKMLNNLLYEEQKTLIKNNPDLLNILQEIHLENAGFWLDEYLKDAPRRGCDWSISYGYAYYDYLLTLETSFINRGAQNENHIL